MAIRDCVVVLARSRKEEVEGKEGGAVAEVVGIVAVGGEGTAP